MTENVDPLTYQNPDHMVWQLPQQLLKIDFIIVSEILPQHLISLSVYMHVMWLLR